MEDVAATVAQWLADLDRAAIVQYQLKDDRGRGLDCLKVVQQGKRYLGVHHSLAGGAFDLDLVESSDLKTWRHVANLDRHAHQGTIQASGKGWMAAWEKDGPNGNWIRLAWYPSLAALRSGKAERTADLARTLSPAAEGTPHFRRLPKDPLKGTIELGFHYYRDADVDRQAIGFLQGFKDWKAAPDPAVNSALEEKYRGNVGDRDGFRWGKADVTLLEVQLRKNDWASWRVLLRAGKGEFMEVPFRTPGKSTSFANPSTTWIRLPDGREALAVSLFLPSQGNAPGESGQMLAVYPRPRR